MRNKFNTLFAVACVALPAALFIACKDDGDTTLPVIVLNSPAEEARLHIGEEFDLDMDLSDNEMLASYKVEIHDAFDGHEHDHDHDHSRSTGAEEDVVFNYERSWNIPGQKSADIHHEIAIPDNAVPGHYHLIVHCLDAANNEIYVAREIILVHEGEEDEHEH